MSRSTHHPLCRGARRRVPVWGGCLGWACGAGLLALALMRAAAADEFRVRVNPAEAAPAAPLLEDLPLLERVSRDGITWTFAAPTRVGRFVNGDYYVVGAVTIVDVDPLPTPTNGRHGSMLDIQPSIQRSGFDSRIASGRYDASLRVYPPMGLTPGQRLVSSRSAVTNLTCVLRPFDRSSSPVASVSILTSVAGPLPPDTFRPSYARGATNLYHSRTLRRELLPRLPRVPQVPPLAEFEGYLRRPWVDSVFFNFDVPAEYMASYGRENGYLMSFAGLLLTLDFTPEEKEPLLVYLVQYGIDLFGLIEQGHSGWPAHGGHGSGRKFPILLAGLMLGEDRMRSVQSRFGEDMQTLWVSETQPAGTYTRSWHTRPETVVYGGHVGLDGESVNPGWGPYEHLAPSAWKSTLGESYRRCCTSVCWVGQALAARLIPGLQSAWNHPQFFAYVDRWMGTPDDPGDLESIRTGAGLGLDGDFQQGQSWKILSGGGYYAPHRTFVDDMWAAYRPRPRLRAGLGDGDAAIRVEVQNATPNAAHVLQSRTHPTLDAWTNRTTNVPTSDQFIFEDAWSAGRVFTAYRVETRLSGLLQARGSPPGPDEAALLVEGPGTFRLGAPPTE